MNPTDKPMWLQRGTAMLPEKGGCRDVLVMTVVWACIKCECIGRHDDEAFYKEHLHPEMSK